MGKINPEVIEDAPLAEAVEKLYMMMPVFICGVNRKANVGNFETVDVYAGIALPLPGAVGASEETLREIVAATAELAISMVAKETADRYTAIKNMMAGQ